ncbi:hypothetical protein BG418_11930 [Streptomyces sp. CBMA152]|nr:hypothetical protein [Streptomyces sp. CBMA152]
MTVFLLVGGGIEVFVLAAGVVAPVEVEVAVGDHGRDLEDRFGAGGPPVDAGDVEAVGGLLFLFVVVMRGRRAGWLGRGAYWSSGRGCAGVWLIGVWVG